MLPCRQVRRRIDCAVVAQAEQADRVDLEVQVERRSLRVARVADEPDHVAGVDLVPIYRHRRERRKVRVVVEIARAVADPEAVAADLVPADGEDRAGCTGEERRSQRGEDVVAVMPTP